MKESAKTVEDVNELLGEIFYSRDKSMSQIARDRGYSVTPILQVLKKHDILKSVLNGKKNAWSISDLLKESKALKNDKLNDKGLHEKILQDYIIAAASYNQEHNSKPKSTKEAAAHNNVSENAQKNEQEQENQHKAKTYNLAQVINDIAKLKENSDFQNETISSLIKNTEILIKNTTALLESWGIKAA